MPGKRRTPTPATLVEYLSAECERLHDLLTLLATMVLDQPAEANLSARHIVAGIDTSRVTDLGLVDGRLHVTGTHWALRAIVASLGRSIGVAPNCVETVVSFPGGELVVTIQRCTGKTPVTLKEEAVARADAAEGELAALRRAMRYVIRPGSLTAEETVDALRREGLGDVAVAMARALDVESHHAP